MKVMEKEETRGFSNLISCRGVALFLIGENDSVLSPHSVEAPCGLSQQGATTVRRDANSKLEIFEKQFQSLLKPPERYSGKLAFIMPATPPKLPLSLQALSILCSLSSQTS